MACTMTAGLYMADFKKEKTVPGRNRQITGNAEVRISLKKNETDRSQIENYFRWEYSLTIQRNRTGGNQRLWIFNLNPVRI